MKRLAFFLLVLFPFAVSAQTPPGFDPQEMMKQFNDPAAMQKLAQKVQEMQACMAKVDQKKLDALREEAKGESDAIDQLCRAGKKDEALKKAMAMGKRMQADPTIKQMRGCTEGMAEMLETMPLAELPTYEDGDEPSKDDICR